MNNKKFMQGPITNFKNEMYNDTGQYQKIYGFEIGSDPQHATWNNEADAFKHAYMQAIGTQRYSAPIAALFGALHELAGKFSNSQPSSEENMDNWNNRVGRTIGVKLKEQIRKNKIESQDIKTIKDMAAQMVVEKMREGKLITSPNDTRKFDKYPHINKLIKNIQGTFSGGAAPINDGNTFFTTEDIAKMSTDEFLAVEDIINNQIKNKIAIPKSEANQGVTQGSYIYISGYTRDDGTKVSGYYRRR